MTPRDRFYKAALDFANELRAKDGKEPLTELPTGLLRAGGFECPLGRATGFCIQDLPRVACGPDEVDIPLPRDAATFTLRFDDGEYPELVEGAAA